jgi:uncharacterized protein with FMN-binding domain
LASASVLIVGYQAGTAVTMAIGTSVTLPVGNASAAGSATKATTGPGPTDGTYTGASVKTRFGAVQVEMTIAGGSISEIAALHLTDSDSRSVQISNHAAPILRSEVISSQSARVSNVGGATYTTQAYLSSVQSALDQAGA